MMTFLEILFTAIGTGAVLLAGAYAIASAWTALDESAERKRKHARRVLELLQQIEANTARSIATKPTDPQ